MPDVVIPHDIRNNFNLAYYDRRLKGCLLSQQGIYIGDGKNTNHHDLLNETLTPLGESDHNPSDTLYLGFCIDCWDFLKKPMTEAEKAGREFTYPWGSIADWYYKFRHIPDLSWQSRQRGQSFGPIPPVPMRRTRSVISESRKRKRPLLVAITNLTQSIDALAAAVDNQAWQQRVGLCDIYSDN